MPSLAEMSPSDTDTDVPLEEPPSYQSLMVCTWVCRALEPAVATGDFMYYLVEGCAAGEIRLVLDQSGNVECGMACGLCP